MILMLLGMIDGQGTLCAQTTTTTTKQIVKKIYLDDLKANQAKNVSYYNYFLDNLSAKTVLSDLNEANGGLTGYDVEKSDSMLKFIQKVWIKWTLLDIDGNQKNFYFDNTNSLDLNFYNGKDGYRNDNDRYPYTKDKDNISSIQPRDDQFSIGDFAAYLIYKGEGVTDAKWDMLFQPHVFFKGDLADLKYNNSAIVLEISDFGDDNFSNPRNKRQWSWNSGVWNAKYNASKEDGWYKVRYEFVIDRDVERKSLTATFGESNTEAWYTSNDNLQMTIDLSKYLDSDDLKDAKYVRWLWYDKNNHELVAQTEGMTLNLPDGYTQSANNKFGYYKYNANGITDIGKVTIDASGIGEIDNYLLIFDIVKDNQITTDANGNVTNTPYPDIQVKINLDPGIDKTKTFTPLPKLLKNGIEREYEIKLNPTKSTSETYNSVALDNITSKIVTGDWNTIYGTSYTTDEVNTYFGAYHLLRWYSLDSNDEWDNDDFKIRFTGSKNISYGTDRPWTLHFFKNASASYPYGQGSNLVRRNRDQGGDKDILTTDYDYDKYGKYVYRSFAYSYNDEGSTLWWPNGQDNRLTKSDAEASFLQPTLYYSLNDNASCWEEMLGRKVICEVSKWAPTDLLSTTNSEYSNEENNDRFFSMRYIFKFVDTNGFISAAKKDWTKKEVDITVDSISSDYYSYDQANSTLTLNLSKHPDLKDMLSSGAKYARLAWVDTDEYYVDISDLTLQLDGFTDVSNKAYGSYKAVSETSTTLLDGIKIKINNHAVLNDYSLVCLLSDDEMTSTDTKEPSADRRIKVNIDINLSAEVKAKNTHEYLYVLSKESDNATIYVYNNHSAQMLQDLNYAFSTMKYAKVYLHNKRTNQAVGTSDYTLTVAASSTNQALRTDGSTYYYYTNTSGLSTTANLYQFTITKKNSSLNYNWKYFQAVVLFSSDETGTAETADIAIIYDFDVESWTFKHYKGYAYEGDDYADMETTWKPATKNANGTMKYQDVHEWTYDVYVAKGGTYTLTLPISGSDEPLGYYRWYDYTTDLKSDRLTKTGTERAEGFFNIGQLTTATFTPPTDYDSWTGDTIACDVSRYRDFGNEGNTSTYIVHEPTLSVRYIYRVHKAKDLAEAIKKPLFQSAEYSTTSSYTGTLYEDNGYFTIGVTADGKGEANLRVNLQNASDYWFYPCTTLENYVKNGKFNESDFGSTLTQADSIKWYAHSLDRQWSCPLTGVIDKGKMVKISLDRVNDATKWSASVSTITPTSSKPSIKAGDRFYVLAYAYNSTAKTMCPVGYYIVRFMPDMAPEPFDKISYSRSIENLENNYSRVGLITFDEDSKGLTLKAPTNVIDNMASLPSKWSRRHYGFVYPGLYDYMDDKMLYAKHGEYTIMKTMGVKGISDAIDGKSKTIDGFNTKWYLQKNSLYDRTYHLTGGAQTGSFLYFDASDEARPVCSTDFDAELCVGSTIVLSAAVADATNASTRPQIVFKLYGCTYDTESGEWVADKLIHSFSSGNLATINDETYSSDGTWYQVFARVTLQENSGVENYDHYMIEVDNACDGTGGADYAVDDIRLYIQPSKIGAKQNQPVCKDYEEDTDLSMQIDVLHESLKAMMGLNSSSKDVCKIRWRVCYVDGSPVPGKDLYTQHADNKIVLDKKDSDGNEYYYVELPFYTSFEAGAKRIKEINDSIEKGLYIEKGYDKTETICKRYYTDSSMDNWYLIEETLKKLKKGETYYVSVSYEHGTDSEGNTTWSDWGSPSDICSVYSSFLSLAEQQINMSNSSASVNDNTIALGCDDESKEIELKATLIVPDPIKGGSYKIPNGTLKFDWFVGSAAEYEAAYYTVNDETIYLSEALTHFREVYPKEDKLQPASGKFTDGDYATLNNYINNKLLYLYTSTVPREFTSTIDKGRFTLYLIPRNTKVTLYPDDPANATDMQLCLDGQEITINIYKSPKMTLGFPDVAYPDEARTIRIGLKQLYDLCDFDNVKGSGSANLKALKLPIHLYRHLDGTETNFNMGIEDGIYRKEEDGDKKYDEEGKIKYPANNRLWVSDCDDASWNDVNWSSSTAGVVEIDPPDTENPYIYLKFDNLRYLSSNSQSIRFHEGCTYEFNFQFFDRGQWNSTNYGSKDRCYGDVFFKLKVVPEYVTWNAPSKSNASTQWDDDKNWHRSTKADLHKDKTDSYTDYTSDDQYSDESNTAFVPMKFTKVTIPEHSYYRYPYLQKEELSTSGIPTTASLTNGDNYSATSNIEYDLMVETMPDDGKSVYDVEKFYGNTCKEIYFKPKAELRNQYYLKYEKAWVEKEFSPNKWYMITTPLSNIWAGDMYVPSSTGRQETEAFKDITFDATNYSRTEYPVYQRSWDKSNSMEVRPSDAQLSDFTTENYDAFINYNDWDTSNSIVTTNWSHVYNDASENYDKVNGIAIKVGKKSNEDTGTALLRLPKADTSYQYYDGGDNGVGSAVTLSKKAAAKSGQFRYNAETVTQTLSNKSSGNKLYLVGNPYMVSIDMKRFFEVNTKLEPKYWTIIGDVVEGEIVNGTTTTYPSINPMQSFFVMKKEGVTVDKVTFNSYMTTNSPVAFSGEEKAETKSRAATRTTRTGDISSPTPKLLLKATNANGSTMARVTENENASNDFVSTEDLETVYDSNLADMPTIFTVAGNEAVSINAMEQLETVPLGVVSSSNDEVKMTVSGASGFASTLYLVDLKEATATPLTDNDSIAIAPNAYGRYYLSTNGDISKRESVSESGITVYSPTMHTLVVSSLGEPLSHVSLYSADGRLLDSVNAHEEQSLTLSTISGITIVKATTSDGKTFGKKVNVR